MCFILNTVIFIDAALKRSLNVFFENMFYDFNYLAKGFRMRSKAQSTLNGRFETKRLNHVFGNKFEYTNILETQFPS